MKRRARVQLFSNDCVVALSRPRQILARISYADPLTRMSLAILAEQIYYVRQLVRLLGLRLGT